MLTPEPEIISDERLEYLAEQYLTLNVRQRCGVTFQQFCVWPEQLARQAAALANTRRYAASGYRLVPA